MLVIGLKPMPNFVSPDTIRSHFSSAMSQMYRAEVPAYGDLIDIVEQTNQDILAHHSMADEDSARLSEERHGAIRVGTADEIAAMALYLASDEAAFTTGTNMAVDGGWTI